MEQCSCDNGLIGHIQQEVVTVGRSGAHGGNYGYYENIDTDT